MEQILSQIDIIFWLVLFVPILFITFYVPGLFVLRFFSVKNSIVRFLFVNVFGLVLWGIQGYIFGYLNIRFLSLIYCLLSVGYAFYKRDEIKSEALGIGKYFSKKYVGFFRYARCFKK
jgi:hypothetical protein